MASEFVERDRSRASDVPCLEFRLRSHVEHHDIPSTQTSSELLGTDGLESAAIT